MAFSLDSVSGKLIDFFYNRAELAANVLFYVLLALWFVVAVIIAPEEMSGPLRALPQGYKALIVAIAIIGLSVLIILVRMIHDKEDNQTKQPSVQPKDTWRDESDRSSWVFVGYREKAFRRLSVPEQKLLLDNYADSEKNYRFNSDSPSMLKLRKLGYIEQIGDCWYCLSGYTCDLFDDRYEELKAQLTEDEASDPADSNKQTPTASSEDMHPDAVIARKYDEGDPETIRKLSIFDP